MKLPNLTPIQVTVPMVFFQPKPVVLMLSLAFGSALYAPVAMGAESLAGNHKQVNFSAYTTRIDNGRTREQQGIATHPNNFMRRY